MFLPLHDANPLKIIPFQFVTVSIIVACVVAFLWQVSQGQADSGDLVYGLGMIPAVLVGGRELEPALVMVPAELTLITSMFLHSGWLHLIGNMLYLWVFGDNIEDSMGHVKFVAFFVACGVAGGLAHAIANGGSTAPVIGASGAVSGVLGAYLLLHPKVKVLVLVVKAIPLRLPAYIVLGGWIALQLFELWVSSDGVGEIALWAHIGGFVAGIALIVPMRRRDVPLFDQGVAH
jgi:membrane associated rhomboid family serine protease